MSGPDGASTKRDQRRETRREQYRQSQVERQRQRQATLRRQAIQRYAIIGAIVLGVILLITLIVVNVNNGQHPQSQGLQPATGQTVDGIACAPETVVVHYHTDLQMWVNGQPVPVPAGTGIVAPPPTVAQASNGSLACLYSLHVHEGTPSLVHIESSVDKPYTLANLFHIWGQQIGNGKFMGQTIDATHPMVIEVYDAQGKLIQTYTGKPEDLVFKDHETFLIKYNSPNAKVQPFNWNS
ncbi:MAG TPA: hypothetical protein VF807_09195 [Ktedonobacterales bacterium]